MTGYPAKDQHIMKKLNSVLILLGCAALMTFTSGCASVLCGPTQKVAINSKPDGAEVLVYDSHGEVVFENATPCIAKLHRANDEGDRASYVILVRKQGFAPVQIPVSGQVNKAYFANALFGGIGFFVDPMTGAMWTLTTDSVDPQLVDEHAAFRGQENDVFVKLKEDAGGNFAAQGGN
jgi:hypothetical protein